MSVPIPPLKSVVGAGSGGSRGALLSEIQRGMPAPRIPDRQLWSDVSALVIGNDRSGKRRSYVSDGDRRARDRCACWVNDGAGNGCRGALRVQVSGCEHHDSGKYNYP